MKKTTAISSHSLMTLRRWPTPANCCANFCFTTILQLLAMIWDFHWQEWLNAANYELVTRELGSIQHHDRAFATAPTMASCITAYSRRWGDLQNLARAYANIRYHHDPVLEHSREIRTLVTKKKKTDSEANFRFSVFYSAGACGKDVRTRLSYTELSVPIHHMEALSPPFWSGLLGRPPEPPLQIYQCYL